VLDDISAGVDLDHQRCRLLERCITYHFRTPRLSSLFANAVPPGRLILGSNLVDATVISTGMNLPKDFDLNQVFWNLGITIDMVR